MLTVQIIRALNRDVNRGLKRKVWSTTLHQTIARVEYAVETSVMVTW